MSEDGMKENGIREALRRMIRNNYPYQVLAGDEPVICETYPCAIIQNTGIFHIMCIA